MSTYCTNYNELLENNSTNKHFKAVKVDCVFFFLLSWLDFRINSSYKN